ncbi:MAG: tetratricopeptide (TPR) repeat protein [Alphaproteobacteria bacterium]|jgi:tetratricopeptide (TPR) repeat protein
MSEQSISSAQALSSIQQCIQQGNFAKAELDAKSLLATHVNEETQTMCWYLLAVGYRLQQTHEDAISALKSLLAIHSNHARAFQELAYNYRALDQGKQASIHFYKATKANPALLSAWQALLPIYQQANQSEAIKLCQTQITQLSALPKPILAATDLLYDGKITEADIVCRRYLQEHKRSIDGLSLLAEIALELKAVPEAEFILETAVELAPTKLKVKYQLFKIYSKLGKFEKALVLANTLTEKDPNNTFYQVAKATALVGVGNLDAAIAIYQQIVATSKAEANVFLLLGHAYKTQGDIKASVSSYQQAYSIDPYCGDAYWSLANTKTYVFSPAEINKMLNGTKNQDVTVKDKIHLHFALGKAYEDQPLDKTDADHKAKYEKAFSHYARGNQLQRSTLTYSNENHTQFVQSQIEAFTPKLVEKLKHKGHNDAAPIFIVGMPRAGSTLLEQILASHSQVDGTMELHEILGLAATLSKKKGDKPSYPHNLGSIPTEYFAQFGKKFITETKVYRQGAAYFIDKMPNNYMHIGLIKLILPNAKIIDARREPMACCFSGFKQLFGEGQEFSYSLTDIALYYKNYVRLMDHWQQLFPNEILLMRHEDMVSDTQAEIRKMLAFCGLDFEQACVDFHKNKRAVKTPSAQQVRQPIYTSGIEQWKHFAPYLQELQESLNSDI